MAGTFAEQIHTRAVGNLISDRLYDETGEQVVAELDLDRASRLIYAYEFGAFPQRVLGRFRLVVEPVED